MKAILKNAFLGLLAVAIGAGLAAYRASAADSASSGAMTPAAKSPAKGFTLHIDALKHFPGDPKAVAHHWCRPAEGGITECALFDSDAADAQLVGVEVVVPTATWKTYSKTEQALWHYHRVEIPKVSATLPGMSPAEAKKVVDSLLETYGKIYLLWDPTKGTAPTGQPSIYVLK